MFDSFDSMTWFNLSYPIKPMHVFGHYFKYWVLVRRITSCGDDYVAVCLLQVGKRFLFGFLQSEFGEDVNAPARFKMEVFFLFFRIAVIERIGNV